MSSNEILILKLNRGRTMLRRIAVASEAMRRKKRTRKCKAIEIDLAALAELNREYGSLSEEDRLALDELNAEGEELKQKLAVLRGEQKKPMPFWDVITPSLSVSDAAHAILHGAGKPLHYRKITDHMLGSGLWVSHGCTPWSTVNSGIVTEMARQGAASRFVRVRRGVYGLREWADQDAA